jgi:L-cystine uptake protein TcyP (sodium:dicarboxylate symporter family)
VQEISKIVIFSIISDSALLQIKIYDHSGRRATKIKANVLSELMMTMMKMVAQSPDLMDHFTSCSLNLKLAET